MDEPISVKGIGELKKLLETQYSISVSNHEFKDGAIIISFTNGQKNLALNVLKFLDAIEFLPNNPTNDIDRKDRNSLLSEIRKQLN